jgi:mono/diheme cytochrome c family protein
MNSRLAIMSCLMLVLVLALAQTEVHASHDWGGIDVCRAYRDTAPPGIDPSTLPEPHTRGAQLLTRYCTQCHALTGPGRHTAEEWPAVLERMHMLMDVSRRFRGMMGSIALPSSDEMRVLGEYLSAHALQPLRGTPHGAGAQAFTTACAACHTLPDPRQHNAAEWLAVVRQMQVKADIMGRANVFETVARAEVIAYLQAHASDGVSVDSPVGDARDAVATHTTRAPRYGLERLIWLTPFFAAAGLGLWRWWNRRVRRAAH